MSGKSGDRDTRIQKAELDRARQVLDDPEVVRQVLRSSARAAAVVRGALDEHERVNPPRAPKAVQKDESIEFLSAEADIQRAMGRLVEHANAARRAGFVTPAHLRELAAEMRMYADALDAIADSRGLTDEVLAEWMGEA